MAGEEYNFGMFIRPAAQHMNFVGSVGVLFTTDTVTGFDNCDRIDITPHLQRNPNDIMNDASIWYYWESTYYAQGGEEFITIGNFRSNGQTPIEGNLSGGSPYFFDGIGLEYAEPESVEGFESKVILQPNPTSSILRINPTGQAPESISCFSITGKQLLAIPWKLELDVSDFPNGLYFLTVEFENGVRAAQRFFVQH